MFAIDNSVVHLRHLQIELYPNDPMSLNDISEFISLTSSRLDSLEFRFYPDRPAGERNQTEPSTEELSMVSLRL
jgi:hypothetical protein